MTGQHGNDFGPPTPFIIGGRRYVPTGVHPVRDRQGALHEPIWETAACHDHPWVLVCRDPDCEGIWPCDAARSAIDALRLIGGDAVVARWVDVVDAITARMVEIRGDDLMPPPRRGEPA